MKKVGLSSQKCSVITAWAAGIVDADTVALGTAEPSQQQALPSPVSSWHCRAQLAVGTAEPSQQQALPSPVSSRHC